MENVDVNNKNKIVKLMISVIILIVIALVGTYALTIWRSQENTELTLRIGDISGFYCTKGDNIEINNIGPIFDYTKDGESTTFSIDNQTNEIAKVTVKFYVTTITDNLKEESFKYVLMTNTNNSSYTVYKEGNFKDVINNSSITLLDNYEVGLSSKASFKLVIYIDGNMENPITMQGGSLIGYLDACKEAEITTKLDNSGANRPVLTDGLIPVMYNTFNSKWIKASTENDIVTVTCTALGDVNGDGKVSALDGRKIRQYGIFAIEFTDEQVACADVDGNGLVELNDYQIITSYLTGQIETFPKGEPLSTVTGTVERKHNIWYDYTKSRWANAVLVSETNRSTYENATSGTEIADADILAFYVWIPRYKYKVWNINKVIGTQSYSAQTTGIDIVFEDSTNSTGTISCNYSYASPSSTAGSPNETCTGSNGDYYTHPAFTFGAQELKGFWISKFEISSDTPSATNGGGNSTTLTPRILPNVIAWRGNPLSNFWKVIYDMQTSNNIYGLPTSRTNTDSHMLTNMEWGAVAYLTNSKYGRCTNGSCTEVTVNNCNTYTTGIGANAVSAGSTSTTCTNADNKYNGSKGMLASTTGNVYGVYDLSGGSWEYTAGNMSKSSGTTYTYYASSAGTNFTYSTDTSKYLIPYSYGTTYNDQTAYNRGRLGDATGEVVLTTGGSGAWYSDYARFLNSANAWFVRGGYYSSSAAAGIFHFNRSNGNNTSYSTRATLTISS